MATPKTKGVAEHRTGIVAELKWRGMIHDIMPGTEALLDQRSITCYAGFDPTADSLHIGNLVPITLLRHFQRFGHKPIALLGGATGLIGDPSGKSKERQLLDVDILRHNLQCQGEQMRAFLDFDNAPNAAQMVNNHDWFADISLLDFIRDIGKHITVNYMMAKDSVKNRLADGMSFTEFTYQLIQGYDFLHLFQHQECLLQIGGSDQWGNIVTGTELIRRKLGQEAFGLTAPLIKKSDGSKFGKSEGGNIWLDPAKTSPYQFYQYWLNCSDEDALPFVKIFTDLGQDEIHALDERHRQAPHSRVLQLQLAEWMTRRVHGQENLSSAQEASAILFGKGTADALKKLTEEQLLDVFEGVPQATVGSDIIGAGLDVIELLSENTQFLSSKGEVRRALKEGSIKINKSPVQEGHRVTTSDLIDGKYLLLQRGKKNYFLVKCE